jgi:hypothetical protein
VSGREGGPLATAEVREEAGPAAPLTPARRWRWPSENSLLSLWLPAILIAIVTTRYRHSAFVTWDLAVRPGLDEGWRAGLAMAAHQRLHFGSDLIFTYGPLGFLQGGGLFYTGTAILSSLFNAVSHVVVIVVVLWRLRRSFQPWIAIVVTLLFAELVRYVGTADTLVIPVIVLGTAVIEKDASPRLQRWIVPILAACSALAFLMKVNVGVSVIAASVLVVWFASPGRFRSELHYGALTAVLFAAGWIASGNRVGDIPTWLVGVYQISSGYPAAMGAEYGARIDYLLIPVPIVTVAVLAYLSARALSRSRKVVLGLVAGSVMYVFFRHAFVRHDYNGVDFFIASLIAALALSWRPEVRNYALGGLAVLFVCVLVVVRPQQPFSDMNPAWTVPTAARQAADLAIPSRRHQKVADSRAALHDFYRLEASTLATLRGKTVHVDPWEIQVAWAYPQLQWKPLPIFQSYSAYTSALDQDNAAQLASPNGPQAILRSGGRQAGQERIRTAAIDGRNPDFESPEATLSMICHFREANATGRWQVLTRTPNRCGRPELLDVVDAQLGKPVRVPSGDDQSIVVAHVRRLYGSLVQRVQSTLFKGSGYNIRLDGTEFSLVPATASGPLLMSTPPTLGYAKEFGLHPTVRSFEITMRAPRLGPSRFEVAFYRIPLD